jgi:D-inositol-3-phosphate glycosyltransferase
VIASNVAGLASVVRDGVTGFLVDGHDPADYADRMRRVLETTHLAEELGWRGSRLARAFSWDRTADQLLERFSDLVTGVAFPGQLGVQATSRTE